MTHQQARREIRSTYRSREVQDTVACGLVHLLIAQEDVALTETKSIWLQEREETAQGP